MGLDNMKFEKEYIVDKSRCINGVVTYKDIFYMMLETSNEQTKQAHLTTEFLLSKGYTWMIYKWRVDFSDLPVENEKIKIVTWASEFKRLNAYREFEVYNEKNELIIKASTIFLIVDMNKKRPIRIPEEVANAFGIYNKKNFESIERIEVNGDLFSEKEILITDENIDINGHVNNLVYLNWIIESLPSEYIKNYKLESINLIYHREIVNFKDVCVKNFKDDAIYTEIKTNEINAISKSFWKKNA